MAAVLGILAGYAQQASAVDALVEPFDNSTQFVTSEPFFSDGGFDYFGLADGAGGGDFGGGSAPGGIKAYTGFTGSFLTGMDLNGEGASLPITVDWFGIDISGLAAVEFSGDFAEFFDTPGDIDSDDFILVEASIDGGAYETVISFRLDEDEPDNFNGIFREDTDGDGRGDGAALTDAAQTFVRAIAGTGSLLDLRLTVRVEAGDEDFAVDNFTVREAVPVASFFEPFDDSSGFVASEGFFSDGGFDYFGLADGAGGGDFGGGPAPSGIKAYTGFTGSFLTGMDLDGEGASLPITVDWFGIDISGLAAVEFSGDFAEFFDAPGDIDFDDFILVEASIDGGVYETVISFRLDEDEPDNFNGVFSEDTDGDGRGDGVALTDAAQTFVRAIAGAGSLLDLRLTVRVQAGDEDFAVDNFAVREAVPVESFFEPFNDSSGFVASEGFFSDGGFDYFGLADGAGGGDFGGDVAPSGIKAYTGFTGSFLTGMDLDGEGASLPITLDWFGIDISELAAVEFSGDFAEFFDAPGDIDFDDFILVEASIDGGVYETVISFRLDEDEPDNFNGVFSEDTDGDGRGDGVALTGAAQTFTSAIAGTGSLLDLRLTVRVQAGDEDFAVDNFSIQEGDGDDEPGDDPVYLARKIHEIQGSGPAVTNDGELVEVQAIVTGLFEDNGSPTGFFLQEEDSDADADSSTSEGIFVFCGSGCPTLAEGDLVTVQGTATDFFGMSQIDATLGNIAVDSTGFALPFPVPIALPATDRTDAEATFEAIEGMLVSFSQDLFVTEYFELARYGQVVLSEGSRLRQFTHQSAPSVTGFEQHQEDIAKRRIILDDLNNDQNFNDPVFHPQPDGFSVTDFFRGGDTVNNLTGIIHWSFAGSSGTDAWRVRPTQTFPAVFTPVNLRSVAPEEVEGNFRVATLNVLNYFTTVDVTASRSEGDCGPSGTLDCRGADSESERQRQLDKISAALLGINADVVGLVELENDGDDATLAAIVGALPGYDFIPTGFIGTDAIKVGIIYKTATAAPVGAFEVLDSSVDPTFVDTRNRPVLAQTFEELASGERFTMTVGHLKSKGSACDDLGDPDLGDGQANCNATRTSATIALANWLASDPTGSGDPDFLILGDLNAYAKEDPITALEAAGYTNLIESLLGADAYSFVFDGQLGYLDHALANDSMNAQVSGITEWHINADEVNLLDYNDDIEDVGEASFERKPGVNNLYNADPYRSSDHDPLIVGLNLGRSEPQRCELDNNGQIDINDINAILARRNQPASGPDDPADADGDGVVTVVDARACVLQCTNARCMP